VIVTTLVFGGKDARPRKGKLRMKACYRCTVEKRTCDLSGRLVQWETDQLVFAPILSDRTISGWRLPTSRQ